MRYRVDDLSGPPLDLAVAVTEKFAAEIREDTCYVWLPGYPPDPAEEIVYSPSTDFEIGEPIIKRAEISVCANKLDSRGAWHAQGSMDYVKTGDYGDDDPMMAYAHGNTLLIAAMRCYVKSRHGEYIDLDEEGI